MAGRLRGGLVAFWRGLGDDLGAKGGDLTQSSASGAEGDRERRSWWLEGPCGSSGILASFGPADHPCSSFALGQGAEAHDALD